MKILLPESGAESIFHIKFMEVETAGQISNLHDVQPMEDDTTVSFASATNENVGKFVPVCKLSRKNYVSLKIICKL